MSVGSPTAKQSDGVVPALGEDHRRLIPAAYPVWFVRRSCRTVYHIRLRFTYPGSGW